MPDNTIKDVVTRALKDKTFREQLQTNPQEAAKQFRLSPTDRDLVVSRNRQIISALGRQPGVTAAGDDVNITIVVVVAP